MDSPFSLTRQEIEEQALLVAEEIEAHGLKHVSSGISINDSSFLCATSPPEFLINHASNASFDVSTPATQKLGGADRNNSQNIKTGTVTIGGEGTHKKRSQILSSPYSVSGKSKRFPLADFSNISLSSPDGAVDLVALTPEIDPTVLSCSDVLVEADASSDGGKHCDEKLKDKEALVQPENYVGKSEERGCDKRGGVAPPFSPSTKSTYTGDAVEVKDNESVDIMEDNESCNKTSAGRKVDKMVSNDSDEGNVIIPTLAVVDKEIIGEANVIDTTLAVMDNDKKMLDEGNVTDTTLAVVDKEIIGEGNVIDTNLAVVNKEIIDEGNVIDTTMNVVDKEIIDDGNVIDTTLAVVDKEIIDEQNVIDTTMNVVDKDVIDEAPEEIAPVKKANGGENQGKKITSRRFLMRPSSQASPAPQPKNGTISRLKSTDTSKVKVEQDGPPSKLVCKGSLVMQQKVGENKGLVQPSKLQRSFRLPSGPVKAFPKPSIRPVKESSAALSTAHIPSQNTAPSSKLVRKGSLLIQPKPQLKKIPIQSPKKEMKSNLTRGPLKAFPLPNNSGTVTRPGRKSTVSLPDANARTHNKGVLQVPGGLPRPDASRTVTKDASRTVTKVSKPKPKNPAITVQSDKPLVQTPLKASVFAPRRLSDVFCTSDKSSTSSIGARANSESFHKPSKAANNNNKDTSEEFNAFKKQRVLVQNTPDLEPRRLSMWSPVPRRGVPDSEAAFQCTKRAAPSKQLFHKMG